MILRVKGIKEDGKTIAKSYNGCLLRLFSSFTILN